MANGTEGARQSMSSHGSDLSTTAHNPNSSQITPTDAEFSQVPASRASTSSSDEDEGGGEVLVLPELPEDPVEGWPQVALLMAKTPDFAAFSRFRDLNIKSLLYYQAQLTTLRKDLHKREYADQRGTDQEAAKFASRADFLMTTEGSAQFKLIKEIREVLKEYSKLTTKDWQLQGSPLIIE